MAIEINDNQDVVKSACRDHRNRDEHQHDDRHHEKEVCCICKKVRFIHELQKECELNGCCFNCEAPKLGRNAPGPNVFNTRPFILYTENGTVFQTVFALDPTTHLPTTFGFIYRVEEIHDCCAVLRVLSVGGDGSLAGATFTATNVCVTVDLCEFIAVQCLHDTFVTPCC